MTSNDLQLWDANSTFRSPNASGFWYKIALKLQISQDTLSANGATLKTIPLPESKNAAALLEKLSQVLLSADFPITD